LVRPNLNVLVEMLSAIPQIEDLSLTTNALLLEKYAQPLKDAGLNRVNISLDTLDPEKFRKITRGGSFEQAWKGILAAERAGLTPIKINAVIMRGVNDDEILDLARLTLDHPWQLRFIELMPLGNQMPWGDGFPSPETAYISLEDIYQRIEPIGLEPVNGKLGNGPAVEYQLTGGKGIIGFISPLSEQHFCSRCNRMRLTADGYLRPCLMSDLEIPILPAMRAGESILPLLEKAVGLKPSGHKLGQQRAPDGRSMAQIGG
jgi:cyclic pyranopterin phosphate synthase